MTLPPAALDQHLAIVGKTGSGKTYAAKGLVERLLRTIFAHRPAPISVSDLAAAVGLKPGNGYWYGGISALKKAGLVEQQGGSGGGLAMVEWLRADR